MKHGLMCLFCFFVVVGPFSWWSQAQQAATATLGGTSWQLVKFQSGDDKTLVPDDKAKYTIALAHDGGVSARIDCNRGHGMWKSSGPNQIEFGPMALTRAMCPPAPLAERFTKDLPYFRSYTIKDGHLFLALMADGGTYEFEPVVASESQAPKTEVASHGPFEFQCPEGKTDSKILKVKFYDTQPGLLLAELGHETRPAFQVLAASGTRYEGDGVMYWEWHGEATVNWSGVELRCKPRK